LLGALDNFLAVKNYLFTPALVEAFAARARALHGASREGAINLIVSELSAEFSDHAVRSELDFCFTSAGANAGAFALVYASLTERILIQGSALDTSGLLGRCRGETHDTVLTGELTQWREGEVSARTFGPGETAVCRTGEAAAVQLGAGTWTLQYGRGAVVPPQLLSVPDLRTAWRAWGAWAGSMARELLRFQI
ncbi:unnamed protein product, partial [Phaeothamnion confervicola]